VTLLGIDDIEAILLEGRDSVGIALEAGADYGTIRLLLSDPAPRDIEFSISTSPSGYVEMKDGSAVTIKEGQSVLYLCYGMLDIGAADITLAELDQGSQATGAEIEVEVVGSSLASKSAPEIEIAAGHGAGTAERSVALDGDTLTIRVSRTGFDDFETEETVAEVSSIDPDSVLSSLPSTVTIPAGESFAEFSVQASGDSGDEAVISATCGGSTANCRISLEEQTWWAVPEIVIAEGGTVRVYGLFEYHLRQARTITASVADPQVATLSNASDSLTTMASRCIFELVAESSGTTTVTLSTSGLPDLQILVSVTEGEIEADSSSITVGDVTTGLDGNVVIDALEGVEFASVSIQAGAEGSVSVYGVGTNTLTLDFNGVAPPGNEVVFTVSYDLNGATSVVLGVLDLLHHSEDDWLNNYFIELP
jgi:hypothetical protein